MHFYKDYLQNLSGDTVDRMGKDMDLFADYVADTADKIWNDMASRNEMKRVGMRHTIERVQGQGDFERILLFHYTGGSRPRVAVIVARGVDNCGRETVAWAEDRLEKRKLQNVKKLFPEQPSSGIGVFKDIDGHSVSCIVACQANKFVKGEWYLISPPYQYDFRANFVKWVMDYEVPDAKEQA